MGDKQLCSSITYSPVPGALLRLVLIVPGGCAAWEKKKPSEFEGIIPPSEEIARLRRWAEEAPHLRPEDQERRSKLLATAIQKEDDPHIRRPNGADLGKYSTALANAVIVTAATKDPEQDVREAACRVLASRGDAAATAALAQVLIGDVNLDVRPAAARPLGQTHSPSAVAALGNALDDPDPAMQFLHGVAAESDGQGSGQRREPLAPVCSSAGARLRRAVRRGRPPAAEIVNF